MSSKNISDTFTSMPDVKSAEKLLHEREVDQSLNALAQPLSQPELNSIIAMNGWKVHWPELRF